MAQSQPYLIDRLGRLSVPPEVIKILGWDPADEAAIKKGRHVIFEWDKDEVRLVRVNWEPQKRRTH